MSSTNYFTHSPGQTLCYHLESKGDICLVFLHGMGGSSISWTPIVNYFNRRNFSTLTIDLLGHGYSDRPHSVDAYSITNQAHLVAALIASLKLKKIVLIGHCLGGMVALTLAGLYPNLLTALIVIDTSPTLPWITRTLLGFPPLKLWLTHIQHRLPNPYLRHEADYHPFIGSSDYSPRRIFSDVIHTSLKSYLASCNALVGYDATTLLDHISIPTLVIVGEKDSVFPPSVSKSIHQRLSSSSLKTIPGANHIIIVNNPQIVSRSILKFLDKLALS